MKKYNLVFLSALLLLLSGCASVTNDIRVGAELAPGATIANNYKTYDWLGSFSLLNDPNNHSRSGAFPPPLAEQVRCRSLPQPPRLRA